MLTGDFLRSSARRHPDKPAIVQGSRRISYEQLDTDADRFANALLQRELARGTSIAIVASNIPEYAIVYFGAARAGCVCAHISVRATAHDVGIMLEHVGAQVVLFDSGSAQVALQGMARSGVRHGVILDDARPPGGDVAITTLQDLLEGATPTRPSVRIAASDPFAITFTGGTTGIPKAVVVSHAARYLSALTATTQLGFQGEDIVGVATPLFHAAGLFVCFAPSILLGATTVLLRSWSPGQFIDLIEREGVTATLMVPTQLGDLISHPAFSPRRVASLRKVSYAGAPMSPSLFARVRTALPKVEFSENYGQSETGPLTVRRATDPPEKFHTVGRRCAGVEVEILRDDGTVAAAGEIGEIVTRGPHVLSEYFGEPALTAQSFRDGGWLRTGDVGFFDAQEFLVLVDRLRDIIICGGENIYPAEIENALYRHPAVAECAAFGIPDDRSGELPAAHVVLRQNTDVTDATLIEFCATQIARHKRPRLVKIVSSLPRTPLGKIHRGAIRSEYWVGRSRAI